MHLRPTIPLAAAALALAAAGWAQAPPPNALDKPSLEAYVRHLFLWGPQITVQIADPAPSEIEGLVAVAVTASAGPATQTETFYVSRDGAKIVRGQVFDMAKNPFAKELAKLSTTGQPARGTPGAPVVLVMFADFQCPSCAEEARTLKEHLLPAYPSQVRLYFKDLPLAQIHPWAMPAAAIGRCVYRKGDEAFWNFHDWIFARQNVITAQNLTAQVEEFARSNQIDPVELMKCAESSEIEAEIARSVQEARSLNISSTPTVFLNGRRLVGNLHWEQLKQVIDHEIEYQKTAKNAGDDCGCEVKLPTPLNQ